MDSHILYKSLAKYYDKLNSHVDYEGEAKFVLEMAKKHGVRRHGSLLDVGCGTGNHLRLLRQHFDVIGVDANEGMLKIAREKLPQTPLSVMDMRTLQLNKRFQIIISMFGAITYNRNLEELSQTLLNFKNHLESGGIAIIDMEFCKEYWLEGKTWITTVIEDNFTLARIHTSTAEGDVFPYRPLFLINDNGRIDFQIDEHRLSIFRLRDVLEMLDEHGFRTTAYHGFSQTSWSEENPGRPVLVSSLPGL